MREFSHTAFVIESLFPQHPPKKQDASYEEEASRYKEALWQENIQINDFQAIKILSMGYLKAIHFKIPVLRDYGDFTDVMTIWDYYPDILDEEGNFNGYSSEDDLPERDMLKERADANGNIPVIDEQGEQEKIRLFKLRLARINTLRAEQGLPELTAEEFLARCRPKEITDESVICLWQVVVSLRDDSKIKDDIGRCRPFLYIFAENISQAKPISHAARHISQICEANLYHCGLGISLCPTH